MIRRPHYAPTDEQLAILADIRRQIRMERMELEAEKAAEPRYDVAPVVHANTRQTVLSWAQQAHPGARTEDVLARAEAYLAFILKPLLVEEVEFANALQQRHAATLH